MIYKSIIKSNNDYDVPVFNDGQLMYSKYNPIRESSSFGNEISPNTKFVLILGLGAAYHVSEFMKKNPDTKILVIENSREDFEFLKNIPNVEDVIHNSNVEIIFPDDMEEKIVGSYLPIIHGDISILIHRAWFEHVEGKKLIDTIKGVLDSVSADFSVQSHFGLLWQRNIIQNLHIASNLNYDSVPRFPIDKTAIIIAAGPSLDENLDLIKNKRDDYFVISTDTAFSVLNTNKIISDVVVSIDAQRISVNHFRNIPNEVFTKTLFVFDLCCNSNVVSYVRQRNGKVIFIQTGHPLSQLANNCGREFLNISSGAGTVTIAACDFAKRIGFHSIKVIAADFAYIKGKPYAKGTYLDTLYHLDDTKLNQSLQKFTYLMYRVPVIKKDDKLSTKILESYRKSLEDWAMKNEFSIEYTNYIYKLAVLNSVKEQNLRSYFYGSFNINCFMNKLKNDNQIALLPAMAAIKKRNKNVDITLKELTKLAYSKILRYNLPL